MLPRSPLWACVNASALRMYFWRDSPPYHSFKREAAHRASLSEWQTLQAFGILWRAVFSGVGMPIVWSRIAARMLKTVLGMWHSTQALPVLDEA